MKHMVAGLNFRLADSLKWIASLHTLLRLERCCDLKVVQTQASFCWTDFSRCAAIYTWHTDVLFRSTRKSWISPWQSCPKGTSCFHCNNPPPPPPPPTHTQHPVQNKINNHIMFGYFNDAYIKGTGCLVYLVSGPLPFCRFHIALAAIMNRSSRFVFLIAVLREWLTLMTHILTLIQTIPHTHNKYSNMDTLLAYLYYHHMKRSKSLVGAMEINKGFLFNCTFTSLFHFLIFSNISVTPFFLAPVTSSPAGILLWTELCTCCQTTTSLQFVCT